MNKLFLCLLVLISFSAVASNEVCIIERVIIKPVFDKSKYIANCTNKDLNFELTSVFLNRNLEKNLKLEMEKRGYEKEMVFQPEDKHPRGVKTIFEVYRKKEDQSLKSVCSVTYGQKKYIDYVNKFLYDFTIGCDYNTENSEYISGDSIENVDQLMKDRDYIKSFTFAPYSPGAYNKKAEITIVGDATIYILKN